MRRGFSTIEAWGYEALIAEAVCEAVTPVVERAVVGSRILDVGCGGGRLAQRLRAPGRDVVGIDVSSAQARRARGVQASALAIPFRDASFDSVVSSCSIKHWPDPVAGLAECRRVLRRGGVLVVIEMDGASTRDEVVRFAATTRVPWLLRPFYVLLDARAVVPTAPSRDELGALVGAPAHKLDGHPYAVVVAS